MTLLGLTGPIGHGKTTFADALAALEPTTKHFESYQIVAEVGNALDACLTTVPDPADTTAINNWLRSLPAILLETVHAHTTYEQIAIDRQALAQHPVEYQKLLLHLENLKRDPTMSRQPIDHDDKEAFRPLLQWLGGYLVEKVDPSIWYKEIIHRVYAAEDGGCQLCIVGGLRFPNDATLLREAGGIIVKLYRPDLMQNDLLDPTERERDNITPDCTIVSNGGIEDVNTCAKNFWTDLQNNSLKSTYYTKPIG